MNPHELVLQKSDDYELIITCPPEHTDQIQSAINSVSDVPITEVGRLTDAVGEFRLVLPDGNQQRITPDGWDHFAK